MRSPSASGKEPSLLFGAAQTLLMKVATTFYRRMVMVDRELHPPPPMPHLPFPVQFDLLDSPVDMDDARALRPTLSAKSIRERHDRGNACFAVRVEGRVAHSAWVAVDRVRIEYLSKDIVLDPADIFIFDSYTIPEYRNRRLAQARGAFVASYYSDLGFRRSLGLVAVENRAGLAVPETLGYRRIGYYKALRLGGWSRTWSKSLMDEDLPNLLSSP